MIAGAAAMVVVSGAVLAYLRVFAMSQGYHINFRGVTNRISSHNSWVVRTATVAYVQVGVVATCFVTVSRLW